MRLIIPVLVLVLLLLTACGGIGSGRTNYEEVNYYEGSDGLVVEFVENMPPGKVYPGQLYPIALRIHNKGAFSIVKVEQSGKGIIDFSAKVNIVYDELYFNEEEANDGTNFEKLGSNLRFAGKSTKWPEGQLDIVTFGFLSANELEARVGADTQLLVGVCYPYETLLTTPVCIDVDPYNADDRFQACQQTDLSFSDQGAPVAITMVNVENMPVGFDKVTVNAQVPVNDENGIQIGFKTEEVEERVLIIKPVFRFTIENVGEGQVVRGRERNQQGLCTRDPDNSKDTFATSSVFVEAYLGSTKLDCSPKKRDDPRILEDKPSEIMLYNGVGEAVCTVPDNDNDLIRTHSNYQTMLRTYVSYVYQSRASMKVTVEDNIKRYEAPDFNYRCADFHGKYAMCKAYSERGSNKLNCYYCESTHECLSEAGCATCTEKTPDEKSRMCITPCPEPDVYFGQEIDDGNGTITQVEVFCENGQGVNDKDDCSCKKINFMFAENRNECQGLEKNADGYYDINVNTKDGIAHDTIDLIDAYAEEGVLCVSASTGPATHGKAAVSQMITTPYVRP